jgi:uroporphyrinogen decarboxylase
MTSRERFKLALNHKEADRVPIDVGGDLHNGIHDVAYRNLLKYLNEKDEIVLYDQMQHLAKVKDSVLERLNSDTRYLYANPSESYKFEIDEQQGWYDEWGVKRANAGLYDEVVESPLSDCTMEDIIKYKAPDGKDKSRFVGLRDTAKDLHENTDYALVGANAASLFFLSSEIIGYQEFMEKILLETKVIEALIDKVLEYQFDFFDGYLNEIGDYVEMVWMGDDWGTQLAPLMSPTMFRDIFLKRYKEFVKFVKSKADVKVAIHSCGAVQWALGDFVDAGIDVVHPLQGDAQGLLDPYLLKKEFGDSLVFYSNLKNQTIIPYGSSKDVEEDVKRKIEALAPNGGFIMSGGHNFQADVPPENILALVDATLKYGNYPIGIHGK